MQLSCVGWACGYDFDIDIGGLFLIAHQSGLIMCLAQVSSTHGMAA